MRSLLYSLATLTAALLPCVTLAAEYTDPFPTMEPKTLQYFVERGVLNESLDGSVHLSSDITRAEFTEAIVDYIYPEWAISTKCLQELDTDKFPGVSYTHLFRDVEKTESYALHLCAAMRGGIVWGYGDGNFRPDDTINLAEASKVISIAFNLGYTMPEYQTDDWYATYLKTLRKYTELPVSARSPDHNLTIGETRIMLQNVSARVASYHGSRVNGKIDTAIMSSVKVQHISTAAAQTPWIR